ncbi:MAG TPA: PEP-CTERM sorting domain-containing protein [Acidobacteriaceae bacterium]|nr:PEP-CTERM sorting domain-containing protein [Acidobacteriaceae bacterium]
MKLTSKDSVSVAKYRFNSKSCSNFLAILVLGAFAVCAKSAKADNYSFTFSGGGMSGSGVLTTSNTPVPGVPGAQQVVGISGTFSDSVKNISGAITGLQTTSLPSGINSEGTFVPPGSPASGFGFSWDNLFYPAGNSPAVCPPPAPGDPNGPYPFGGGLLDIYGVLFDVQGGYTVDLWSNGVVPGFGLTYGVGDSKNGTVLNTFGEPFTGTSAAVSASPTPEPGSLLLLGTGMAGLLLAGGRKVLPVATKA